MPGRPSYTHTAAAVKVLSMSKIISSLSTKIVHNIASLKLKGKALIVNPTYLQDSFSSLLHTQLNAID